MTNALGRMLQRLAPHTTASLADLHTARRELGDLSTELHSVEARLETLDAARQQVHDLTQQLGTMEARVESLETTVAELQEEIDETRRDGRRVAELYDLVFERLKSSS